MKISRRFVLLAAACAATAGLPFRPGRAWAITTLTMGDFQIDSLSDGHLELPVAPLLERVPEAEVFVDLVTQSIWLQIAGMAAARGVDIDPDVSLQELFGGHLESV